MGINKKALGVALSPFIITGIFYLIFSINENIGFIIMGITLSCFLIWFLYSYLSLMEEYNEMRTL